MAIKEFRLPDPGEGLVEADIVTWRVAVGDQVKINDILVEIETIARSLPEGVEIVTVYDRSNLILSAIETLRTTLLEESIVVALVTFVFLLHFRSSLVAIIMLPVGLLMAFTAMRALGIGANIMSLGGIAIAIGAMIDAAIVMIENAHKHLENWKHDHPDKTLQGEARWKVIGDSAVEVGPALFFSLLIITLSFIPVFTLEAQEGRLFSPLAFTKTYAMAAAAFLSITLIPVLMGLLIKGKIPSEEANPLNRWLIRIYRPAIDWVLARPKQTLLIAVLVFASSLWPVSRIGGEFLPQMNEGDLLYMPSALPGLSAAEAGRLLQRTDRLIRTVPEVERVFGKAGRAETATDPAPLSMAETVVLLKPESEWRARPRWWTAKVPDFAAPLFETAWPQRLTHSELVDEMDAALQIAGTSNAWTMPIKNRVDMLATGIRTPVGVKIYGPDPAVIERIGLDVETALRGVPGTSQGIAAASSSVFSGR